MLKKLLISCFVFTTAIAVGYGGCGGGSSSTGKAGSGGGTAGGTAGTTAAGTAGTTAAGTAGTTAAGTAGTTAAGTAGTTAAGTAGTTAAGTAGAGGGTAGAGGGTAGAGGGTAGAGGAGGKAGAGGAGGGQGGAGGANNLNAIKGMCTQKRMDMNAATPFTASDFCALYADVCGAMTFAGVLTPADCETTYTSWATKKIVGSPTVGVQNCTSYHLCNANQPGGATGHCPHATALAGTPCAIAP